MTRFPIALAALAMVSASPAPRPPDARAVLDLAKAASGGAALDALDGSHESGVHGGAPYQTWLDFRHYGMRSESGSGDAVHARGFNGRVTWQYPVLNARGVSTSSDPATLAEAITTAFSSNNGFFYPERFPMVARYLRADALDGRAFDVIEVKPEGGRAFELWFDRETHLMGRIADPHGTPAVTVDVSDYRRVGPALIGFHGIVKLADGTQVDELKVGSVEFGPVDRSRFDPPAMR